MPTFAYRGVKEDGSKAVGRIQAADKESALAELRTNGILARDIAADKEAIKIEDVLARRRPVPPMQLALFTRQMATLVDSGISVLQALSIMERQIENVRLRDTLREVIAAIEGGDQLATALRRHPEIFGTLYTAMIEAGESSGTLDTALLQLALQLEREAKLKRQIKAAMRYPIIVLAVVLLVLGLLLIFVVPKFTALFSSLGGSLPLPTQVVLGMSSVMVPPDNKMIALIPLLAFAVFVMGLFVMLTMLRSGLKPRPAFLGALSVWMGLGGFLYMLQFSPAWLTSSPLVKIPGGSSLVVFFYETKLPSAFIEVPQVAAIAFRIAIVYVFYRVMRSVWRRYIKTEAGRRTWDSFKLRAPMKIGPMVQKVAMARFTRTLSTLTAAGVPILSAFDIVRDTAGNVLIEEASDDARRRVAVGSTIYGALDQSSAFPQMVTRMVEVGEETGALDEMLLKAAEYYEEEVDAAMKNLSSLIEPVMVILIGTIVGSIVIALYLPIFKVYSLLGG